MSLRTRLLLGFVLVVGVGFYFLVDFIIEDLRPRYLEAVEESLVDQSQILATIIEGTIENGQVNPSSLEESFQRLKNRKFQARIYKLLKTHVDERVYVTDGQGRVIFDSEGQALGKDFSTWNDVYLTLQGKYGARSTRDHPEDPTTSVLHVAAPIYDQGEIVGVVSVRKPTASINFFFETARPKIMIAGGIAALGVIIMGIILSLYLTRPIKKLTHFARAVRDGRRVPLPKLGHGEIQEMGEAFDQMREALEGRKYVEQYVQTLTHELKSPLAAIQGAVEILAGEVPEAKRRQFLENIASESGRMLSLVERLLELAALESRHGLQDIQDFDFSDLVLEVLRRFEGPLTKKALELGQDIQLGVQVSGEKFLMEHALQNLLQNAIDFSPERGRLSLQLRAGDGQAELKIWDEGPGIPSYAMAKIFDRFYSLPRPQTGKKSSGLGLSFVKRVVELHGGKITLSNIKEGGVLVHLILNIAK